jgi:hypothetical protein
MEDGAAVEIGVDVNKFLRFSSFVAGRPRPTAR